MATGENRYGAESFGSTAGDLDIDKVMLMIIFDRGYESEVIAALREANVEGYTESTGWYGIGHSGPVMGSQTWPGENALVLTAVPRPQVERVVGLVRRLHDRRRLVIPGTGMAVFAFPCAQLL
ncbi:MAG: hypothetical protein HY329_26135 [Chloroflexi bacterium]|nr:hypothetical protein [Chloroflexota bacterium]